MLWVRFNWKEGKKEEEEGGSGAHMVTKKGEKKKKKKKETDNYSLRISFWGYLDASSGYFEKKRTKAARNASISRLLHAKRQTIMRCLPEFLMRRKFLMYRSTLSCEERFFFFFSVR